MLNHDVTDKARVRYVQQKIEQDLALRNYHPTIYWRLRENLRLLENFNGMMSKETISNYRNRIRDFFYGENNEVLSE